MTAVLIVTNEDTKRTKLERSLSGVSLFTAGDDGDALDLARYVDVDVVIRDGGTRGLEEFLAALRRISPRVATVVVGATDHEIEVDAFVPTEFTPRELSIAVRRAAERARLMREVAALRAPTPGTPATVAPEPGSDSAALARVLKELTRVFAVGFDLPRTLDVFLDAVTELVRPSRMALLLPDEATGALRIRAERAVPRRITESVRLATDTGLLDWLRRHGRPARIGDVDLDVAAELRLLQAVVAVPLAASGELLGVLALGEPVVRPQYSSHDLEMLFDVATHVAATIRNISLHHQLASQKEFSERILAHMSNGVVTIGRDERIGTLNRRAAEILELRAEDTVGADLRVLPSPLGDMLFETMSSGRSRPRTELQLALGGRWLEVSTYPVFGDESAPLGAVLVFEDLTAQKELTTQKRQAEQFQLLARVIARIADEIKNPLVSIHTFVELMDERFDDLDFRKDFGTVVGRDVRRVVQVFEKLVGLVTERELNFTVVDVRSVVDEVVSSIHAGDESTGPWIEVDAPRDATPYRVTIDVPEFRKAVSYLVWYLAHNATSRPGKISISIAKDDEAPDSVQIMIGSRNSAVPQHTLQRLFDPVHMVQESLIDVGPAVSQRIIEALGGRLRLRQTRHELAFVVSLPAVA